MCARPPAARGADVLASAAARRRLPATCSGLAVEGALELVEVIVVVPGQQLDEVLDGHFPPRGVDAAALPLLRLESAQEAQRLVAPRLEGGERLLSVVALVLALHRPTVGLHG